MAPADARERETLSRVVALIDMDCFYCACERAIQPELLEKPFVVVQYNPHQGDGTPGSSGVRTLSAEPAGARLVARGDEVLLPFAMNSSIIAVSYEARAAGVTRFMRAREACETCPGLVVMQVPTAHGKSDMGLYRSYGAQVLSLIREVCGRDAKTEKASIDEMYIDITLPARSALKETGIVRLAAEAAEAETHVAGPAEGKAEASLEECQRGPLGRSAFRGGHKGQVACPMSHASREWWKRTVPADWSPHDAWPPDDSLLAAGAAIVARARAAVRERLGFTCSAGVASNKLLAKLCCGLHKPDQQTVLPLDAVADLLDPLPVDRLRGFGGKLGDLLKAGRPDLGLPGFDTVGSLRRAGESLVSKILRGEWSNPEAAAATACRMASGFDDSPVEERPLSKQVGASKNFSRSRTGSRGPLDTMEAAETWLQEFAEDVFVRLAHEADLNERHATQLVVGARFEGAGAARSKRCKLRPRKDLLVTDAMSLLRQLAADRPSRALGITLISLTAEGFISGGNAADRDALQKLFKRSAMPVSSSSHVERIEVDEEPADKKARVANAAAVRPSDSRGEESEDTSATRATATSATVVVSDDESSPESSPVLTGDVAPGIRPADMPADLWTCTKCTFLNQRFASCCSICATPRSNSMQAEAPVRIESFFRKKGS
eukprot:TRINITY_DN63174_c0_g1_i1.p1 TRINITY_DN63174_c0_g1~~TRINITY_DN63174_c0_g1_i1.p1  ORF type:complete len:665 (-),score=149.97 TRINITY_DN63174_c0_g1_i1:164-2158(-)